MTLGHHDVNTLFRLFCFHVPNTLSHQDACTETTVLKTDRLPALNAFKD